MTPLHYACERSCVEQVESILSHCKDNITDRNNDGLTPLDIVKHRVQDDGLDTAEKHRIEDMVTLLRNNGGTTGREDHDPGVWLDSVCTISSASPSSLQSVESPESWANDFPWFEASAPLAGSKAEAPFSSTR